MAGHKNIYAEFDRSQLAEKTRVFTLAKALGVPSKELVVALSELGVVKVAQSTLTRAESEQLLDALANAAATDTTGDETADDAARLEFHGSPTVLVDGVDLFPTQPVRSLACRVYATERGYAGAPTPSQIEEALHETYR